MSRGRYDEQFVIEEVSTVGGIPSVDISVFGLASLPKTLKTLAERGYDLQDVFVALQEIQSSHYEPANDYVAQVNYWLQLCREDTQRRAKEAL